MYALFPSTFSQTMKVRADVGFEDISRFTTSLTAFVEEPVSLTTLAVTSERRVAQIGVDSSSRGRSECVQAKIWDRGWIV